MNTSLILSLSNNEYSNIIAYKWLYLKNNNTISIDSFSYNKVWKYIQKVYGKIKEEKQKLLYKTDQLYYIVVFYSGKYLPIIIISILLNNCIFIPMDISDPRYINQLKDIKPQFIIINNKQHYDLLLDIKSLSININILIIEDILKYNKIIQITDDNIQYNDSISHIIFTSGSTGNPKGCLNTYNSLYHYCKEKIRIFNISNTSNCFIGSSHVFDPLLGDICSTWLINGCITMVDKSLLFSQLGKCLQLSNATHILTTPSLFSTILENPNSFKSLHTIGLGGEPIPKVIIQKWASIKRLINVYGVTECCVYQMYQELSISSNPKLIGHPFNNINIHLVDVNNKNPLDSLNNTCITFGEIWISGKTVGLGYFNRKELTSLHYYIHPILGRCFRTGDIAQKLDNGEYLLKGRKDWQVKIRGNRVELTEIENVILSECKQFLLHIVCIIQKKTLIAWCVLNNNNYLNNTKIIHYFSELLRYIAKQYLPLYMIPCFMFISNIPYTNSGKYNRIKLIQEYKPIYNDSNILEKISTPIEKLLATIWTEELGINITSKHTNFIQIGGDSLIALRICRKLAQILQENNNSPIISYHNDNSFDNFGINLGYFIPGELIQRPILQDYANYISNKLENNIIYSSNINNIKTDQNELHEFMYNSISLGLDNIFKYLLDKYNNIDNNELGNMLRCACTNKQENIVKYLLEYNINPNIKSLNNITPLHLAIQSNSLNICKLLYEYKALLGCIDNNNQTIYHYAARGGVSSNIINWLYNTSMKDKNIQRKYGKHINIFNITDKWKRSSLHWSTVNGHRNTVQCILLYNVNKKLKDCNNETALEIAERRAKCGAKERQINLRPSVFADIATLLGGSGDTKSVNKY